MEVRREDGWVRYSSRRSGQEADEAVWSGRDRATGPAHNAVPGTLEYFLTERYCLYTLDDAFHAFRVDIHHPPWPLQTAEAEISANTMAQAAGLEPPARAPILHMAARQDVVAWRLMRVG